MRKFNKACNLVLISILGGMFLCQDMAYALRLPLGNAKERLRQTLSLKKLKLLPEDYQEHLMGFREIVSGNNSIALLVVNSSGEGSFHSSNDKENIIVLDFEKIISAANTEGVSLPFATRRVFLEELGHAMDDMRIKREKIKIENIIKQGSPLELYINESSSDDLRNDLLEISAGFRMLMIADSDFEVKRLLVKLGRTAWDYSDKEHFKAGRFVFEKVMERIIPDTESTDYILYMGRVVTGEMTLPELSTIRRIARDLFVENLQYLEPDSGILPYINDDGSKIIVPSPLLEVLGYIYALFEKQTGGARSLEEMHSFSAVRCFL